MSESQHEPSADKDKPAPKAVVGRVSLYLRQLESAQRQGLTTISSSQLGSALSIGHAQVRKDLAYFGQFGSPGIGYPILDLIAALRHILGIDRVWPTALIGLGNLGRALLKYRGFRNRGFHIVALFDVDARKIGQTYDNLSVLPLEELPDVSRLREIRLAILSVPADSAQKVADLAVSCGIRGVMNFAPLPLILPREVSVVAVDLSVQLEHLAYKVLNQTPRAEGFSTILEPEQKPAS